MSERLTNSLTQNGKQPVVLSNRNVIINGAMQVAQRSSSIPSITTSGYYTADRIATTIANLGTWTQSVETDAPTGSGFRNSVKMLCTPTADASPSAGDFLAVNQNIEGQNLQQFAKGTASAKSFTLSFWVKSNVTGTYTINLYDNNNARSVSAAYTISVSATWEKKTITFPADTTGAFTNDNGLSLQVYFGLATGSNYSSGTLNTTWAASVDANRFAGQTNLAAATSNYWQVTGIQLEVGSVATPFEFENIGTTLAKCQRYFTKSSFNVRATPRYANGVALANVFFMVSMRSAPSVAVTDITGANNCDAQGTDGFKTYTSGAHTNDEGQYSWTASAELA